MNTLSPSSVSVDTPVSIAEARTTSAAFPQELQGKQAEARKASAPTAKGFPEQPVHPELQAALHAEAARLRCAPKWKFILEFDQYEGFPIEAMWRTLRGLEGTQEPKGCLFPRNPFKLQSLIEKGVRRLRFWWKKLGDQAYYHWYHARDRACESLEELEAGGRMPAVELHDGFQPREFHEFLADSLAQSLLAQVCRSRATEEARAVLLILESLSGETQAEVYQAAQRLGYSLPAFAAARRWMTRHRAEY